MIKQVLAGWKKDYLAMDSFGQIAIFCTVSLISLFLVLPFISLFLRDLLVNIYSALGPILTVLISMAIGALLHRHRDYLADKFAKLLSKA